MASELNIGYITLGYVMTNSYFIQGKDAQGENTNDCIFIDPADQGKLLYEKLREKDLNVVAILLTHGHYDHILGVKELQEATGAPVYACVSEKRLLSDPSMNLSADLGRPCTVKVDHFVKDGDELTLAGFTVQVIETPGHTEGSCCFYLPKYQKLFSGDTLFQESVGRTDLPTGSMSALTRSIEEKLLPLPGSTEVFPGHGDLTNLAYEKQWNPYLRG